MYYFNGNIINAYIVCQYMPSHVSFKIILYEIKVDSCKIKML